MPSTLGIIGAGNMGQAILRGVVEAEVLAPDAIVVAEVDADRRAQLAELGCAVTDDPRVAAASEQVLLAVKPQSFPDVARIIAPLEHGPVVISIMAGLTSGPLRAALGESVRVIRVMPNTPTQVRLGISAIAFGEGARPGDDDLARRLFGAIGEVVTVREDQIYAVTAVSGGGPAYACLLAEAMTLGAIELGIEEPIARKLAIHTIHGAGALMVHSGEDPARLREAVTSKGGTTFEALKVMYDRDLPRIVADALAAARDRGIELDG